MFSFCCVDVVDNLWHKVNIVCLLIYFLSYLSYSSKKFCVPMEWSTESIEKVICFVQECPFLFGVSVISRTCMNLHENLMQETCARNKLVQVSCTIFLTVCHHHKYSTTKQQPNVFQKRSDENYEHPYLKPLPKNGAATCSTQQSLLTVNNPGQPRINKRIQIATKILATSFLGHTYTNLRKIAPKSAHDFFTCLGWIHLERPNQ